MANMKATPQGVEQYTASEIIMKGLGIFFFTFLFITVKHRTAEVSTNDSYSNTQRQKVHTDRF